MRPLSLTCPKALMPFCGRPLLKYTFGQLRSHEIKSAVLVIGPCDTGFEEFASRAREEGTEIKLLRRGLEFGSAGVVRHVAEGLDGRYEQFLVIYGDSLFQVDLTSLLGLHESKQSEGCEVTLAYHTPEDLVIPGRDHTNYGIVCLGENARVIGFFEKPAVLELPSRHANAGVFVLNRKAIELFPAKLPLDFSHDVFAKLALGPDSPVFGFDVKDGYRFDIGTIGEYVRVQFAVLDELIPLQGVPWARLQVTARQSSPLASGGRALVGTDCRFGKEVTLRGRNIIGDRVSIGDRAELCDCVIFDGTTIGPAAKISGAILGRCCQIAGHATVSEGTVLGDFSIVA